MTDFKPKRKTGRPPKRLDEALYVQVAALAATGATRNAIAKQLEISPFYVNRIFKSEEFQKQVRDIAEEAVGTAKNTIRFRVAELATDVLNALTYQLRDKSSIEAVKVALKVLGFGEDEQVKNDTNIQVVLPGVKEESVSAEYRVQNEED